MITNLAQLLRQAAEKFQDQTALVGHSGLRDDVWSFRRLNSAAESIAWQLLEVYRFSPGDRILIHGFNSPQLVATYFGCFISGLIAVPIDRHSPDYFIARLARMTQARALLSSNETLQFDGLQRISPDLLASVEGSNQTVHHLPQADDIAEIVFTSGTTGNPKGVVLTHKNIITNVQAIENVYPKQPATRFLSLLPLSHMFEQTAGLFAPLCRGATVYYLNNFQSTAVMRKMDTKNIHGVIAVPQMLEMILHSLEKQARAGGGEARWQLW